MWKELASTSDSFNVAHVDCTREDSKVLCEQYHIRGYPSLVFIKGDKRYPYQKKRQLKQVKEYAEHGYELHDVKTPANEQPTPLPFRIEGFNKFLYDSGIHFRSAMKHIEKDFP